MYMQYTPFVLPLLLSAVVLLGLGIYAKRFRIIPATNTFPLAMFFGAAWALAYALDVSITTLTGKMISTGIRFPILALLPVVWLVMTNQFAGRPQQLNRRRIAVLLIIPAITIAIVLTSQYHQLFLYACYIDNSGPIPVLLCKNGPWYWAHLIYSYTLFIISAIILGRSLHSVNSFQYRQTLTLITGTLVTIVTDLLFQLGITPLRGFNPASTLLWLLGLLMAWGLFRYRILEIVPIARSTVVDNISDLMLVFNSHDRLVDFNLAAQKVLGLEVTKSIGQSADAALGRWPDILEHYKSGQSAFSEIKLGENENRKTYVSSVSPIKDKRGNFSGRLVLMRDITEYKQVDETLRNTTEELNNYFTLALDLLCIADTDGYFRRLNRSWETTLGFTSQELTQRRFLDFVHPDDLQSTLSALGKLSDQKEVLNFINRYRCKDGTYRWIEWRSRPVGKIIYAAARDITERVQMEQALSRYANEMAVLYNTSLEINSQTDISQLLNAITRQAAELLRARMGGLYLLAPDYKTLELVVSYNLPGDFVGTRLHIGEGISGRVAQSGKPLMVADHRVWEGRATAYNGTPFRRVLGVPIKWGTEMIGVINITDDEKTGLFTDDEVRLMSLFADQAAIAIKNARLLAETNRRAEQLAALNRIGQAVTSDLELDQVLKTLSEQCQQVLPIDVFYVAMYDNQTGLIYHPLIYDQGKYSTHNPRDVSTMPGLGGEVIQSRKTLYVPDLLDPNTRVHPVTRPRGKPTRSFVGVPLIIRDQVVGVLSMQNYQPDAYTPDQIRLLETIATQAAIAVENARLFEQMKELAITDSLSRLYNRHHFFDLAHSEIERARRYKRALAMIMMDIDHFKVINDTFGHTVGDQVLQALADQCRHTLRTIDIVGRYGGEEFVIVMPETHLEDAQRVAERLRQAIASIEVAAPKGIARITVSQGVAGLDDTHTTLEALLDCADQALYAAKQEGRNRVEVYGVV
jgi:diguanylate cyclase (GGDEF)-like protein/PAS domain S-box-containing protein